MRVWIVMPVINCLSHTRAAIESMRSNDNATRLLVVNNGSTDGTAAYLAGLAFGTGTCVVLSQTVNLGVAASWNLGIKLACEAGAECVVVANNDILCAPDTLDNLVQWVTPHRPFVTATAIRGGTLAQQLRVRATRSPLDFCLFALHPSLLETVGWFDDTFWPAYWEDRDYEMRMRAAGIKPVSALDALVIHVGSRSIHEGGVKNYPYYQENRRRFQAKYPTAPARMLR